MDEELFGNHPCEWIGSYNAAEVWWADFILVDVYCVEGVWTADVMEFYADPWFNIFPVARFARSPSGGCCPAGGTWNLVFGNGTFSLS